MRSEIGVADGTEGLYECGVGEVNQAIRAIEGN